MHIGDVDHARSNTLVVIAYVHEEDAVDLNGDSVGVMRIALKSINMALYTSPWLIKDLLVHGIQEYLSTKDIKQLPLERFLRLELRDRGADEEHPFQLEMIGWSDVSNSPNPLDRLH